MKKLVTYCDNCLVATKDIYAEKHWIEILPGYSNGHLNINIYEGRDEKGKGKRRFWHLANELHFCGYDCLVKWFRKIDTEAV